jgi:hypothetical protein
MQRSDPAGLLLQLKVRWLCVRGGGGGHGGRRKGRQAGCNIHRQQLLQLDAIVHEMQRSNHGSGWAAAAAEGATLLLSRTSGRPHVVWLALPAALS